MSQENKQQRRWLSSFFQLIHPRNIWTAIRHGLVLHGIKMFLATFRIRITPYYWMQEGIVDTPPPPLQGEASDYTFEYFGDEELKEIASLAPSYRSESVLLSRLREGKKCFGAKYRGQIAAFMWLYFDKCLDTGEEIHMKDNEAYLCDMYTFMPFRGKNIAPHLRYQGYKALREMGRDTFYSVSEYFNSSAIAFKEKLKAKCLWLGMDVDFFGRYRRQWIIKRYD